jgi:hypothetical protein
MTIDKKKIESSLKQITVSYLREIGFKGSFPNFYRDENGFVSLINFQFYSAGGSFCVNVSYADPDRRNIYIYEDYEPKKLRVSQTREHIRLKTAPDDDWFVYGETNYGVTRGTVKAPDDIATTIIKLLEQQAVVWLTSKK